MTRLEKIQLAIQKGFTYNSETGIITGVKGLPLNRKTSNGYIIIKMICNKKVILLLGHQFAWYCIYNETVQYIDHIDRDRTNNKKNNLRSVTQQQNQFNNNVKGYTFIKSRNNYKASIRLNGKSIFLGYFNTAEQAGQAYLKAKEQYHII